MTLAAPVLAPEDLRTITADVWAAFLRAEGADALGEVATGGEDAETPRDTVHATVAVTGAWRGRVVLALPPAAAERAAVTVLGADLAAAVGVADVVGEVVNMIGGHVKSLVAAPSVLGLPVVARGPLAEVAGEVEECAVDLRWLGHAVRVSVRSS